MTEQPKIQICRYDDEPEVERDDYVCHYTKGFVPNSYKWRAVADRNWYSVADLLAMSEQDVKDENMPTPKATESYTRQRSFGNGFLWHVKRKPGIASSVSEFKTDSLRRLVEYLKSQPA